MTAKDTRAFDVVRYGSVDELPPAPPLSKAVKAMSDAEVERRAAADPDAGAVPDGFWDSAQVKEPEGTEQITLRLPRRVLGGFVNQAGQAQGRPVGVAVDRLGALLVADDVGNVIWRVSGGWR